MLFNGSLFFGLMYICMVGVLAMAWGWLQRER